MADKEEMPNQIAAWRFSPEKADEWINGGWSLDHDRKTTRYINAETLEGVLTILDGAESVERRGAAYFIREKLGILSDEKPKA